MGTTGDVGAMMNVIRGPECEKLNNECARIKNQLAALIEDRDDAVIARFMDVGKHIYGIMQDREREGNWLKMGTDIFEGLDCHFNVQEIL